MTNEEFGKLYDEMTSEETEIGRTKGQEYTVGNDRLDNFKRLGRELGLDPKQVLWVYLRKHIDAIASYLQRGGVLSEPIEGRIKDARVYLGLLRGLIEEERRIPCNNVSDFKLNAIPGSYLDIAIEKVEGKFQPRKPVNWEDKKYGKS